MKTALITLGFLLATTQAAPRTLKSLLQQDTCSCTLSGDTGSGLAALGQATYTTNNNALTATVGEAIASTPDTEAVTAVAAQVCSCQTGSFTSQKSLVKTNNFDFGGRIDVVEAATSSETSSSASQSAGSAQKQSTTVINNEAGTTSGAPAGSCITQCLA